MKTRFEKALMKLYTAFHEGTLNAGSCHHCAVGNIVGSNKWSDVISCAHVGGDITKEYFDELIEEEKNYNPKGFNEGVKEIEKTGYTPFELINVEHIFMTIVTGDDKDLQFKGLCEVVKYLAELDGVENPMEIMHLFKNKELVL